MLGRTAQYAIRTEGRDDRIKVLEFDRGLLVVVADGAGGMSGGAAAAQAVVDGVARVGWDEHAEHWVDVLRRLDHQVGPGQTTAVVLAVRPDGIAGCSVGDSHAWWFSAGREHCLTRGQKRKPLLGSGEASPVGFSLDARDPGALVVATDGLWNYSPIKRLVPLAVLSPNEAAQALVEAVRYPGGTLPDDVAVAVIRLGEARAPDGDRGAPTCD